MRIVIDFQAVQSPGSKQRGIGRYSRSLIKELIANRGSHEILLVLNGCFTASIEELRATFKELLPPENLKVWYTSEPVSFIDQQNEWRRKVAELSRESFIATLKPDVVIVTSLFEGLGDNCVTSIGISDYKILTAVIQYDLIPLIFKKKYLNDSIREKWYNNKLESLHRADLLLSISESSRQEAIQVLEISEDKVISISSAANECFQPLNIDEENKNRILKYFSISKSFILHTGGIDFHKNIEGLIRAFASLPKSITDEHQLVIVSSISIENRLRLSNLASALGLKADDLILTGYVNDEDLIMLYNLCKVFVFPSLYEGFGLPALEAMSCGKAVIGSNTSSLPEVIGRTDALFDPNDDNSFRELLSKILSDSDFRQSLEKHGVDYARNFSWEKSAKKTIEAIENLLNKRLTINLDVNSDHLLPKLAYFSPLPPERSGISDYSAELLPELTNYYQIDVINDQTDIADIWIKKNCEIRSYEYFVKNSKSYDRVLYHFGNSPFHKNMFSSITNIPGVVVLHDFYLSGIIGYLEETKIKPNALSEALYQSHGYLPFNELNNFKSKSELVRDFPCNLDVLQNAVGIIVHSNYSCELANQWYGKNSSLDWSVIPLVRVPSIKIDPIQAREKLNISLNSYVVCSFGMLQPMKQNKELLNSWLDSSLSKDENCILVFVGENPGGEYGDELDKIISESGVSHRIHISGWVNTETYNNYLAAADLGVQVRTNSRGETSAALLDCLNYGLTTIANTNGSISELPDDVLCKISDKFENSELVEAIESHWKDEKKRKQISEHAKAYIHKFHKPDTCAERYARSIESFYKFSAKSYSILIQSIGELSVKPKEDTYIVATAIDIAQNFPLYPCQKQLFVDVSALCQDDLKTGIQRVVRSILKELLKSPPYGFRVEPVYADFEKPYRYARQFTMQFLDVENDIFTDEIIEYKSGDLFLGLDLCGSIISHQYQFFQDLNKKGVEVNFVVYDLLPIRLPDKFPQGASISHEQWFQTVLKVSDRLICISKSTASDVLNYIDNQGDVISRVIDVSYFHLGSDIENSIPTKGLPVNSQFVLDSISNKISFLMVGTIEPRKGHEQVLNAFNLLWEQGLNINLIIVGKQGWMVEELMEKIEKHPQLGRKLFLLQSISDEYLEKIYVECTCLLNPSLGEGFGLPLIEAAKYKIPIIARDLEVFREVAGEHASYFSGTTASDLYRAIKDWIILYENKKIPGSEKMTFFSWEESTQQLVECLFSTEHILN